MSGLQTGRLLCLIIAVGGPWFNPTLVIAQFQEYTDSLIKELHQSIFEKGMVMGRLSSTASWPVVAQPQLQLRLLTQSPARSLEMGTHLM